MTSFDEYAAGYEAEVRRGVFGVGDLDLFAEAKARALLDAAKERLAAIQGVRTLDVGCGLGGIHQFLAPLATGLCGIDVSPGMIEAARSRNPAGSYLVYDGRQIPFEDESFDFTYTICVLHHVEPDARPAFLAELHRVTRRGGIVAVVEHNPFNPLTRVVVSRIDFDEGVVLIGSGRARKLLEESGFSKYRARHILTTPFRARPFRALDARLGRLPLGAQYVGTAVRAA